MKSLSSSNVLRIRELVGLRESPVSMGWIIVAIIPFVVGAPSVAGFVDDGFFGIIAWVASIVFFYLLMTRRNRHYERVADLHSELIQIARATEKEKGVTAPSIAECERTLSAFKTQFRKRSAVVWSIISIGAFWHLLHFHEHQRWESDFFKEFDMYWNS